ncbi:hypothetical protein ACIGMX_45590 [Streptomyces aquilus]
MLLWHEPGLSGPGWDIHAHRAHVDLAEPDNTAERLLARVLITRALSGD